MENEFRASRCAVSHLLGIVSEVVFQKRMRTCIMGLHCGRILQLNVRLKCTAMAGVVFELFLVAGRFSFSSS